MTDDTQKTIRLTHDRLNLIKVAGFKSIHNCNIRLSKNNILIGSNGAGKSNFISLFSLLHSILEKELQVYVAKNGLNTLFYNGPKFTNEIFAEFFFGNNSYGFRLQPSSDNRLFFREEFFGYYGRWDNTTSVGSGHFESRWDKGGGNRLDEFVIPVLKKESWRVYHFHDTSDHSRLKQEHNLANNLSLMADAGNLAAFLYRLRESYPIQYKDIVSTIQLVAPFFKDFVLETQENNPEIIILRWQQFGSEDVFNASQLSDGTLRFICLTTLLKQPYDFQPATIIVDEPELGLHPFAINLLADMIYNLPEDRQTILSTQSVELLNHFDPEDVIVVDRSQKGSVFKRLTSEELETWLEQDYALGELWKKNIFGGRLTP